MINLKLDIGGAGSTSTLSSQQSLLLLMKTGQLEGFCSGGGCTNIVFQQAAAAVASIRSFNHQNPG